MAYVPETRRFKRIATALLAALGLLALAAAPGAAQDAAEREDPKTTILVIGDSLTAGYGLPAEDAFPAKLQAALRARGRDVEVINGGISGDTTAGGRARLKWALSSKPDYAIIELGGNDGLRGLDPKDTRANLDAIIAALKKAEIPVLLTGMMAPRNLGAEYAEAFDAIFPELAKKHDVALYPFFLDGVALDPKLNQPDLIHPNAKGVDVIVERILPHVEKLLGKKTG